MRSHTRSGFTLLELSIVLVIIGLLIGGIIIGKELVRASEIRSIMMNIDAFKAETSAFRIKYNGLPGDITNATSFLGSGVTNGDGDSQIDYLNGELGEEYNAWNHLSAADLIAGNFTGAVDSLPKARIPGALYRISYQQNIYTKSANMISINAWNTTYSRAHNAILTPTDAFSVDAKMDDGFADRGKVLGYNPEGVPGCVTNYYSSATGDYILTNSGILCKLYFLLDF